MNNITPANWFRVTGQPRVTLLAIALIGRILLYIFDPPHFVSKQPLIIPFPFLVALDVAWAILDSIIMVECIRVLTFRRTQSLPLKKHFAFVVSLIVLLGVFKLVTAPKTAARYYNYAWSLAESQNYSEALRSLDIAIRYNPKDVKVYLERAYVERRLGNYTLALADSNTAITMVPNHARAYVTRGQTYYHLGEYAMALKDFEKAIRLDHRESETLDKWIEATKKQL